tara:strand:- start:1281 stop:1922 length:642 start_codon:yes stop_codon:yes gene_type:complete
MGCQYNGKFLMKKVILQKQNLTPHFIGAWTMEPLSICDELIDYFETNKNLQKKGETGDGNNLNTKDSTDIKFKPQNIKLPGNEVFEKYFQNLFYCYQDYVTEWPFLETFIEKLQIGSFNLQRYQRGQHFKKLHTERSSLDSLHRIFAWMTYLNDVKEADGGSTFFCHYDLEVQPKKGLTLIWPAEWTHAHKGNVLKFGNKYIITGWMNFSDNR